ncbi:Uncharacterised protein [Listeria newyorkensis]|nr:Uncharacterised protein [Listeria newyorkensis]
MANKRQQRLIPIIRIQNRHSCRIMIQLKQRPMLHINLIQRPHKKLILVIQILLQIRPFQFLRKLPFQKLPRLIAHEIQFFPRVRHQKRLQRSDPSKLIITIAWHFVHHRLLAMHHFIMGQRQNIILLKHIHKRKRHEVKMILAKQRVHLEKFQNIVHPTHIPLIIKTKSVRVHRHRHTRISRTFLRDHQHIRIPLKNLGV